MRLALSRALVLKAASWRDDKRKRRGFVGLKLGALALELHLRPRHYSMLAWKAGEAACRLILADPRKYRPSQTDPVSGAIRKKALSERVHLLPDGTAIGRDQAAAWVLWQIGENTLGLERAAAARLETVHQSRVAD